ncbi:hypothetical protein O3M35_002521 [Rhynocoris fuscipes]|uniref:Uncharacterized protein n=1 Tax=Rhynocoris fuscipes TaxID=488301 RepID=A0AAW1CMD8_9HEMI
MALLLSEDSNNHQLKSLISTHLLPTVSAGLSDHSTQVVKVAESALLTMLEHCLIGSEQIENRIWPVIKGRMQQTPSMENTIGVLNVCIFILYYFTLDYKYLKYIKIFQLIINLLIESFMVIACYIKAKKFLWNSYCFYGNYAGVDYEIFT